MKVKLKRDWFGPNASLYDKGVREIPGHYRHQLPSDAVILGDDDPDQEPQPATEADTFASVDQERQQAEAAEANIQTRLAASQKRTKQRE